MNQPPNTTKEKSKCCNAKIIDCDCTSMDCISKMCSECCKEIIPTPSVCEVAKGECTHRQGHEEDHNGNCYFCGLNMLTPTEPKKTVEKICRCKQFGKECCLACKITGSCLCGMNREGNISSTPIQTGNDEWSWEETTKQVGKILKLHPEAIDEFILITNQAIQKAVLQERERNETKILGLETVIKGQEIMLESLLLLTTTPTEGGE